MDFKTTILMTPVAKGRPRMTTFGGHARAYTPVKTSHFEHELKSAIAFEMHKQNALIFDGPLDLELKFFIEKPKSKPKRVLYPTTRPDVDNYAKAVLDAANGVLYTDDSMVVNLIASKRYGLPERIEITVNRVLLEPQSYQGIIL